MARDILRFTLDGVRVTPAYGPVSNMPESKIPLSKIPLPTTKMLRLYRTKPLEPVTVTAAVLPVIALVAVRTVLDPVAVTAADVTVILRPKDRFMLDPAAVIAAVDTDSSKARFRTTLVPVSVKADDVTVIEKAPDA